MNKFNLPRRNIEKDRRLKRAERRKQKAGTVRASSADISGKSGALALQGHSGNISGKQRAKLTKKWRRAQKEALQSGLVTMHDIEMMTVDEEGGMDDGSDQQPSLPKSKKKFSMKKRAKLSLKSSSSAVQVGVDGEDGMMQ